jgi:hypothetical protein
MTVVLHGLDLRDTMDTWVQPWEVRGTCCAWCLCASFMTVVLHSSGLHNAMDTWCVAMEGP